MTDYKEVLAGCDESLEIFEERMAKFIKRFCSNMVNGQDFTLKVEVHGNKGKLIHFRSFDDEFARPHQGEQIGKQRK